MVFVKVVKNERKIIMENLTINTFPILVIIGAIVWGIRKVGINSRYLPIVSMFTGLVLGLVGYAVGELDISSAIIGGIMAGAMTSGFYDAGKTAVGIVK